MWSSSPAAPVREAGSGAGAVDAAITKLDGWLETMRGDDGYSGPIAHWWEGCLLYTGAMVDWRYEGIICGYVELFGRTGDGRWLRRAQRAGDDAVACQIMDGHFANSSFQFGAQSGGTPHEAAVDVGLLELARVMREHGLPGWERYVAAAERNIDRYLLGSLWTGRGFSDQPYNPVHVPNKNATIIEALLLSEEVVGRRVMDFVQPAATVILENQVQTLGPRAGATVHTGTGRRALAIGIYTARCLGALLRLHRRTGERRYGEAALAAGRFLARQITTRGTRFGYYPDDRPISAPQWISPSGDILRALVVLGEDLEEASPAATALARALIESQHATGGIPTAHGFAARGSTREWTGTPEFRDVLPVAGWCDKVLRALALLASPAAAPAQERSGSVEVACTWRGRRCRYHEDAQGMTLVEQAGRILYRWRKGAAAPDSYAL